MAGIAHHNMDRAVFAEVYIVVHCIAAVLSAADVSAAAAVAVDVFYHVAAVVILGFQTHIRVADLSLIHI